MSDNKVRLGAYPCLYPMPTVLVGTLVKGSPNFITISFVGIIQQSPPMVSISLINKHYTNQGIRETQSFSINIPNRKLLRKTDFIGMNSGEVIDKSSIFNVFYGDLKTVPLISETPINLECKLVDIIQLDNNSDIFIGEIVQSWSEDKYLRKGIPSLNKLDPILFSINSNSYFSIGRRIGKAWNTGLSMPVSKVRRKTVND